MTEQIKTLYAKIRRTVLRSLVRIRATVPPGLRTLLGLLLICGGVFGFLPILGFWMVPLGVMVVALDVAPMVQVLRARWTPETGAALDPPKGAAPPGEAPPGER